MADIGDTQVTLGATQDTGDQDGAILDGAILDIGDHVITETILIIMEEEVPQHTTEAAETIAQTEILPLEETTLQTEIILTEVSTTEAIQQIETTRTEQTAILTTEEVLMQTTETTQQAQRSQTEEARHKDKVTATIIQTEDQAPQLIEATTIPIAAHLELTLLAHRVQ